VSPDHRAPLRGVKIVCTLGPATTDEAALARLVDAGMDVARLNFSHGSHAEHGARMETLRRVAEARGRPVALLQDLQGPKVRIGEMAPGTELASGGRFVLERGQGAGDAERACLDDSVFFEEVEPGDRLLLSDGAIELEVAQVEAGRAVCRVLAGGPLASRKGVNVPRGLLARPILDERDRADLAYGAERGVDLVAVSYVRNADDLRTVRRELRALGARTPLVAKIETAAAVENLEEILDATDAVMLARGDLALETPFERVPLVQRRILDRARRRGRPVITATQMLVSMVREPRPTRAEVADVAHAVLDGSDAVMLSEETAVGRDPARAVATMARIAAAAENEPERRVVDAEGLAPELHALGVMAAAAARTAEQIGARALLAWTRGGLGARLLSRASRRLPILAPTRSAAVARRLQVVRGVTPVPAEDGTLDPAEVREVLGTSAEDDSLLVVLGHEHGPGGRRVPWLRVGRLDEPDAWVRDPGDERRPSGPPGG